MATINAGNDLASIWGQINVSPQYYPFADAVYSIIIPERKMANHTIKPRNRKDWGGRNAMDMMDTEIDVELYANDLQTFWDWLLMSKNGLSNWQFSDAAGKWWNYVENVGNNLSTPIGTWLMGTLPSLECGDKDFSVKIKAQGGGFRSEYKLMTQVGAIAYSGGVSGTAISGFLHKHYDMGDVGAPGILSVTFGGGDSIPYLEEGSKITLDTSEAPYITSPRHQPRPQFLTAKLEINTYNSDLAQTQQALEEFMNTDQVITVQMPPTPNDVIATRGNKTIILNHSAFVNATPTLMETSKFTTAIVMEGRVPLDSPAWAGSNVVFTPATNTLQLNRIGVA